MSRPSCPRAEDLLAYQVGTLPEEVAETLIDHLANCPACQTVVEKLPEGSDSFIANLRRPAAETRYGEEPEFSTALRRAKAVIAWNRRTNDVRSGQLPAGPGFTYWLLKFDGVSGNKDKELEDPQGYGAIEYAYSLMARAAGITMAECRLLDEHGRRHFMTRRFDRLDDGSKLHMQSLGALGHFDYNQAGAYAYEQAFLTIRQLGLPMAATEEQFRRMLFNVVARNQDDHVKNIAFLMNKAGEWRLAPAFDVTYSYNPSGSWTATHQMTLNGKRDGFLKADIRAVGKSAGLKQGRADTLLDEVTAAVERWPEFAARAKVPEGVTEKIRQAHSLDLGG